MQKQPKLIRIRKSIFTLIILATILAIATPVLADYLGPDRTTTESHVESFDYGVWAEEGNGCFSPSGNPSDCIICDWERKPGRACGSATYHYKLGTQSEVVTTTINLPPATISRTLQNCTLQNGWCITSPELFLNSNEPLSGHSIITIEGTWNGEVFACVDPSCNVPLAEGNNNFTYWAISSWGDSSTMGTFNQKVDTVSPNVGLAVNGSNGANGWYVSQTAVTATGSDSTSGLYETNLSVDNGVWQPSAVLSDGVYDVAVRAVDNAGNISNSSTTISVDTITPSLNVSLNGTSGNNNWFISKVTVSATASDMTSGIALLEFSADGGAYQSYMSPVSFSDGYHTYQFKATDNAGNLAESPVQEVIIDTTFPAISLTEESALGDTFYFDVQDDGSGLAVIRGVIDDEDERFPKISWQEPLSGNNFKDEILWDGKFRDHTQAPLGMYYVTIKVADFAGNEAMKTGTIKVEPFSFLQIITDFVPPFENVDSVVNPSVIQNPPGTSLSTGFGGTTTKSTETTSQTFLLSSGTSTSTTSTSSESNVLWGVVAAAVIGAATAYALEVNRKRKAAEALQLRQAEAAAAKLNAAETARKAQEWQDGQNILNALIENALTQGASDKEIADLKTQATTQGLGAAIANAEQLIRQQALDNFHAQEMEFAVTQAEQQAAEELQAGLMAYYLGRKTGEFVAATTQATPQELTIFEKAWNWAYEHQVELSLGTGIAMGLAAVAGVVLGIITAPAWIVIGAAVLLTALLVTAGTLALNAHFGLDLGTNLAKNLVVGAAAAFITTGVGFLLVNFLPIISRTVTSACIKNPVMCTGVGTIIDGGEQALLSGQLAYYTWMGDQNNAGQVAIELQLEQMDGGVPGNVIANEMGEQLVKLGDVASELIATYGDDIVPLLVTYGDNAVDIIGSYGDEGIALLLKYGDEADEAIDLVKEFGTPAVALLDIVDPTSANKLLTTLDDDVLDYAIAQGPDAVSALSRWGNDELTEFGPELAIRAKKDAKVLEAISMLISLGPIDPKNLTTEQQALINIIAENSMQYTEGGQIVLGKWVDYGNGFTYVARETGSIHYNPHPDMWDLLGELGDGNRDEVAWLINKQVIQTGIDKGLPFEYTLEGIPADNILNEQNAIQAIFSGETDEVIKEALDLKYIPIRVKELQELYKVGYEFIFDEANNSFIFSMP